MTFFRFIAKFGGSGIHQMVEIPRQFFTGWSPLSPELATVAGSGLYAAVTRISPD